MFRRAALVIGALALVALLGCSEDGSSSGAASSSATTTAKTSSTTDTSVPATVPFAPADSAQAAATAFINAWRDGNQLAAATIAVPDAVNAVFSAGPPGSVQNRGCNSPPVADAPVRCVYRTAVGEVTVQASPREGGWIVDQARISQGG